VIPEADLEANGEHFIQGAWDYLVKGIQWAKKYGLKVIIDLVI
jgi:aryl-phospho-beta-D-glucosidase BglC (GH1 family)